MKINGWDCIFMPMCLFANRQFLPLSPKVKGSTLGWYVNRKFVSYKQLKKVILDAASKKQQQPSTCAGQ